MDPCRSAKPCEQELAVLEVVARPAPGTPRTGTRGRDGRRCRSAGAPTPVDARPRGRGSGDPARDGTVRDRSPGADTQGQSSWERQASTAAGNETNTLSHGRSSRWRRRGSTRPRRRRRRRQPAGSGGAGLRGEPTPGRPPPGTRPGSRGRSRPRSRSVRASGPDTRARMRARRPSGGTSTKSTAALSAIAFSKSRIAPALTIRYQLRLVGTSTRGLLAAVLLSYESGRRASQRCRAAPDRRRRVRRGRGRSAVHESLRLHDRRQHANRAIRRDPAWRADRRRIARSRATRSSARA